MSEPTERTIRVVLVDDHALVRAGIRALLENLSSVEIVGEATNGREALDLVRKLLPDVAMLDVSMPELDGLETLAQIRADHPTVRVILLTVHDDEEHTWQAMAAGASGYLLKDSTLVELELAVRAVASGGTYLTPRIARHVFAGHTAQVAADSQRRMRPTPRQRSIARLIARGLSNREIAHELGLSVKTVGSHRTELMARLGVHEVAGVVRYAMRTGLIDPDDE